MRKKELFYRHSRLYERIVMKSLYNVIISVFLILLTVLICKNYVVINKDNNVEDRVSFNIKQEEKTETIRLWKNDEGNYFVFLPSYAEIKNVSVRLSKSGDNYIYFDGERFSQDGKLESIELSREYILSFDGEEDRYPIQFLKSANVASMYVNTKTGSMERLYADKSNREKATIALYTSDGKLDYSGLKDSIKGHGNSTFLYGAKKSFLIDLNKPNDLLGMGSAIKWVLLANAFDATNMRNKIVLDFAKNTSLKWTPDCEYVDLYLNGEYNGLYLLCEKVEVGENRLNIDKNNGFLFTQNFRKEDNGQFFSTKCNRTIEMVYPRNCSEQKFEEAKERIDDIEFKIMNQTKESNSLFDYIDLDTWATRYLIDEFFLNIDGDSLSSYFYCNDIMGKIYAGPVWDYDLCMDYYKNRRQDTMLRSYKKWYRKLNKNAVFLDEVKQIYKLRYKERFKEVEEKNIDALLELTYSAAKQNNLRWGIDNEGYNANVEDIRNFISIRIKFLEEYWFGGGKYYDITIALRHPDEVWDENANIYRTVIAGRTLSSLEEPLFANKDIIWIDLKTGSKVDFNKPIFEDKIIYAKSDNVIMGEIIEESIEESVEQAELNDAEMLYLKLVHYLKLSILYVFLIALIFLAYINIKNQQRGRRK